MTTGSHDQEGEPLDGWHRLHPLTPLLRGGRVFAVVAAVASRQVVDGLGAGTATGVLVVVSLLGLLGGYLSWRATRWGVVGGDLRLDTGVLFRRSRRVPLSRLQAVDVVRGIVARPLGLAELRLEVVGQGKTEAPFAYLSDAEARRLRTRLLELSRGGSPGDGAGAGPADTAAAAAGRTAAGDARAEVPLLQVPTAALVESLLRNVGSVAVLALLVVLLVLAAVDASMAAGVAVLLVPLLLGVGGAVVRRLLSEYGFRVSALDGGLLLRHGLLETRTQTIPAGRVQAVRVVEPRLWRGRGWVRIEVDVAGYGSEDAQSTAALVPVAPRDRAEALLARVLPGVTVHDRTWRPAPDAARWLAPLAGRNLAADLDDTALYSRSGWLNRTVDVVLVAKLQSLRLTQGPVQRRLGLATLHPDTAGKRLGTALRHRRAGEARRLLDAADAAGARARASRDGVQPPPDGTFT